jgi:hypothetical protein
MIDLDCPLAKTFEYFSMRIKRRGGNYGRKLYVDV